MYFSNIIGHGDVLSGLRQNLEKDNFEGIYLFYGPGSVGKFTIAQRLSKYLSCVGVKDDHCRCKSCRLFPHSPDYLEIAKDEEIIKVSDIANIENFLSLVPFLSERRVVLIDNVHKLHHSAANGLLKILEEIKKNNVIILVTAHPEMLLPTIVSRSYKIPFKGLHPSDIISILKDKGHKSDYFESFERMIPMLSGQMLRDFSQYMKYIKFMPKFLQDFSRADEDDLISKIYEIDSDQEILYFLEILIVYLNDLLRIKYDSGPSIINIKEYDKLEQITQYWSDDLCVVSLDKLGEVIKRYKRGLNLKLKHLIMPAIFWMYFFMQKDKRFKAHEYNKTEDRKE